MNGFVDPPLGDKPATSGEPPRLDLDIEIRSHLSRDVDAWVERLLAGDADSGRALAGRFESDGYHLRVTRDDLVRENGNWSTARARGYKRGTKVKDPFHLRLNAYRVLLTRGRDGAVVYVLPLDVLDETARYLETCGFSRLLEEPR